MFNHMVDGGGFQDGVGRNAGELQDVKDVPGGERSDEMVAANVLEIRNVVFVGSKIEGSVLVVRSK